MRKLKSISFLTLAFLLSIQCLFIQRDNPLDPDGDNYTGTGTGTSTSTGTGTGTGTGSGLSITVTNPPEEGATANKVYIIGWDYSAEGIEHPYVTLYYDTDNVPGDENLIIENVRAEDYSYVWDCSKVKNGSYYILAVLDDGNGLYQRKYVRVNTVREKHIQPKGATLKQPQATAKDYSDGKLVIDHSAKEPTITVTAPPAQGANTDKSYIIRWTYTSGGSNPKVELLL